MSTLTKEWLLKTIAELEEERDATPGAVNEDAAMSLAAMKIALVSLEAEAMTQVLSSRAGNDTSTIDKALPEGTMLYTAPPAPISVPDEREAFNAWNNDTDCPLAGRDAKTAAWLAWRRRAAMLQGAEPVSNRDELPDGWVACSERMPEDEQEVITHNIFGYRHVSFFDEHSGHFFDRLDGSPVDCVEHVLVSHWMPMPAAPQQEVK
ncbi:DUF551 domain-containing protein [Enterobacter hormaechei]|nr:DUF551 domain-containing protein [Enterobacter hormaechei]